MTKLPNSPLSQRKKTAEYRDQLHLRYFRTDFLNSIRKHLGINRYGRGSSISEFVAQAITEKMEREKGRAGKK
jgi:hypothetical protein